MKIYTKTGDKGETALLGGKRVSKSSLVIEAIGEVDELNGLLGVLVAQLGEQSVQEKIQQVQQMLFRIGSGLAAVYTDLVKVPAVTGAHVEELEQWIDVMEMSLPPLTQFILPGGSEAAAQSFLARAVCRRAERALILLHEQLINEREAGLPATMLSYINRLSDALFVLGRWLNQEAKTSEILWKK